MQLLSILVPLPACSASRTRSSVRLVQRLSTQRSPDPAAVCVSLPRRAARRAALPGPGLQVPDGLLVFFPSYKAMDEGLAHWKANGNSGAARGRH